MRGCRGGDVNVGGAAIVSPEAHADEGGRQALLIAAVPGILKVDLAIVEAGRSAKGTDQSVHPRISERRPRGVRP